jgi:hypothetical protein
MDAILATIVAGGQAPIQLNIEVNKSISIYINLVNLVKSFDSGHGQYMPKATRPLGGVDSSNPRRWRSKRLNHHGDDVCCVFVLCVAISLIVCKKSPEHNLKVCILLRRCCILRC